MDAEKVKKVCKKLEDKIEIAYRNADLDLPSNQMHVVYPIRVDTCDAKIILSAIRELKAENERLRKEKDDAVKRITEEIDLNPAYEPDCGYTSEIITFNYQLGYQEGLQKALNIINEP